MYTDSRPEMRHRNHGLTADAYVPRVLRCTEAVRSTFRWHSSNAAGSSVAMIDLETLLLPPAPLVALGPRTPSHPFELEKVLPYDLTADSRENEAVELGSGSPC